jgi:hypothetical protein
MNPPPDIALSRRDFLHFALLFAGLRASLQNVSSTDAGNRYLEYDEARPVVESGKLSLPSSLASLNADRLRAAWPQWVRNRDVEIRSRLQRGEEDTLANFVLFGVSFTDSPRVTPEIRDPDETDRLIRRRVQNFVDAVAAPRNNERLVLLAGLITRLGYSTADGEARERLGDFVMENVSRYLSEQKRYERTVDLLAGNDTAPGLAATPSLYKDRGLSVDTDFRSSYAIEKALAEARRRGLLRSVRRVAIIGPGLDFTDKNSGFDHYPLQTLQPFAVVDSLVRVGLSSATSLHVSILEISIPTLDHLARAVAQARAGRSYTVQLVLDRSRQWDRGALNYWRGFGAAIGSTSEALALPPQVRNADRRAIRIRPEIVRLLEPLSQNVVLQRLILQPSEHYDLVIGTNVFIYYDSFEQALALLNVESMLAPGGLFLTNDLMGELPGVRLRPAASLRVAYSENQSDQVQIYSRSTFQPQLPPN